MDAPIGERLKRREDPRLVQGRGVYVGDMHPPGLLHVAFARCPHGHARVTELSFAVARAVPGVVTVLGPMDLLELGRPMPPVMEQPGMERRLPSPLAAPIVRHAGEAVAVVIAENRYSAADGVDAIRVSYDLLPMVRDAEQALKDGSPLVHDDVPGNIAGRIQRAVGDIDAAFAGADIVLRERFITARAAGAAIEPRSILAQQKDGGGITLWDSTQAPHSVRRGVARALELPEEQVRVITPDVGGGFGPKGRLYPEEIALAALARHLGRPVLWEATRQEDLLTTYQGRGVIVDAELAARTDGTILGLRARLLQDCGAYLPTNLVVPLNSAQHLIGPYRIRAFAADIVGVYTHKAPLTPLRGGGREQGVYVTERLIDHLARRLQRDPMEIRLRNALRPEEFPHDTGYPNATGAGTVVYDSGDYPAYLKQARTLIDYDTIKQAQPAERSAGHYRGVAITSFLEATSMGQEAAHVEVNDDGTVQVIVGSPSTGQSHATTLTQVCAARLGVPVERVTLTSGDTGRLGEGTGTFGSRMAVMAGNAVAMAAAVVRDQALQAAAALWEVSVADLDMREGIISVRGSPGHSIGVGDLAHLRKERGEEPSLRATRTFAPERPTCFAGGAHAAIVEVDVETGHVQIERYVVVHDCGTTINPLVVEGQVQGGIAHGVGNVLYEMIAYDDEGKLLTDTFQSYAMPLAQWIPKIEIEHDEHPSPNNPEGIKGAGEGGTIGALATIAGAIEDALGPWHPTLNTLPLRASDIARVSRSSPG